MAETGHKPQPAVCPSSVSALLLNWSHLDFLRWMLSMNLTLKAVISRAKVQCTLFGMCWKPRVGDQLNTVAKSVEVILLQPDDWHITRKYTLRMKRYVGFPHGGRDQFWAPFHNTLLLPSQPCCLVTGLNASGLVADWTRCPSMNDNPGVGCERNVGLLEVPEEVLDEGPGSCCEEVGGEGSWLLLLLLILITHTHIGN